ncbi:MAG: hypothetical protein Q9228_003734 [Teloschistes exilis]
MLSSLPLRRAACQSITCTPRNYRKAQKLTNRLCGPLYSNNNISATAVSAAIATGTSAAASALKTADPANPDTYPPCASACITSALQTDCGTFNETKCVCQSPVFFANITPCEVGTCPPADLQTTLYLSEANCNKAGIGGLGNREAQLAAFNATLGGAAGGDLEGFFDQLMEGGNDGSANDESGNDGSGNDGSGNDGSGNDGSGNDGSWNDGSGNDGSGNDGSVSRGSEKIVRRTDGPTTRAACAEKVERSFFGICGLWWFWCNE